MTLSSPTQNKDKSFTKLTSPLKSNENGECYGMENRVQSSFFQTTHNCEHNSLAKALIDEITIDSATGEPDSRFLQVKEIVKFEESERER